MDNFDFVPKALEKAAALYRQRNAQYGDSYKCFGPFMRSLMQKVVLESDSDFARFAILTFIAAKLNRYANNFSKGGHEDSLEDISVYCHMLQELDNDLKLKFKKIMSKINLKNFSDRKLIPVKRKKRK